VAYWVKIHYEREDYFIDLDRISSFVCAPSGRLTFWLPESSIPVILNRQSNSKDYYRILHYIEQIVTNSLTGSWIKLLYDRKEFIIDLNQIGSFCCSQNKLKFWLPESSIDIVLTEQSEPEAYRKVREFLIAKTGQSLS